MKKRIEGQTARPVFLRPTDIAERWHFHPESVRRKIRRSEIPSVIIGGRRLVLLDEIEKIEREGIVGRENQSISSTAI